MMKTSKVRHWRIPRLWKTLGHSFCAIKHLQLVNYKVL